LFGAKSTEFSETIDKELTEMKVTAGLLFLLLSLGNCFADEAIEAKIQALQSQIDQLNERVRTQHADAQDGSAKPVGTTIGGYGEFNYNNYRDGSVKDQADLRRFVLFFGHDFNDQLQLFSELEVEHAGVEGGSGGGEVAVEQAYLQFTLSDTMKVRAGLLLMPGGFLNEYHEPPAYFGVERNEVETRILPSTWRELGVAIQGQSAAGIQYNVGISTSPDASKFADASNGVRDMRSEGREAAAHDLALFAGLNYRAIPGLALGGSVFTGNTAQGGQGENPNPLLSGTSARLTLWDVHARYTHAALDVKALYARGTLSGTDRINEAVGITPSSGRAAPESFFGWYVETAYRVWRGNEKELIPFVRLERYNTQKTVAPGYATDDNNNERVLTTGVSFRVHPQVVIKADFQNYASDNLKDRINIGLGYLF
jgi:hypothetical protein